MAARGCCDWRARGVAAGLPRIAALNREIPAAIIIECSASVTNARILRAATFALDTGRRAPGAPRTHRTLTESLTAPAERET